MRPVVRLALVWVRRRGIGQTVVLLMVSTVASLAIVTGLTAGTSAQRVLNDSYQKAGRPDLVVVGSDDAVRDAAEDPAVVVAGMAAPVATDIQIYLDDEPIEVRITAVDPDSLPTVGRPELVTGRWPAPGTAEVVAEQSIVENGSAAVGDRLDLRTPQGIVAAEVVGTVVDLTGCFAPRCHPVRLFGLDGLVADMVSDAPPEYVSALRLDRDESVREAQSRLLGSIEGLSFTQAWPDSEAEILEEASVLQVLLTAVGILLIVTACLVVASATTARLMARRRAFGLFRAVGYRPGQLTAATLVEHMVIGAVGVVIGWLAGSALASSLQLSVRGLGGAGGLGLSPMALVASLVIVECVLVLAVILPAWQAARRPTTSLLGDAPPVLTAGAKIGMGAAKLGAGPSTTYGLRRALARPGRAALVGGALLVAATGAFLSTGLIGLFDIGLSDTPLTGKPWEAYAIPTGASESQIIATLDTTEEVGAWYLERTTQGTVGGGTYTVRVLDGDPSAAEFVVHEGRAIIDAGEAMVGYGFLQRSGHQVGDVIELAVGAEGATELEVVGWFSDLANGGEMVQVRQESLPPSVAGHAPLFRMVSAVDVDPEEMAAAVADRLGDGADVVAPELMHSSTGEAVSAMAMLILLLGGVAAANLLAVTVAGHRERARSFGILKAVGCTPNQLIGQSAVGTAIVGAAAGVVGVAIGVRLFPVFADLFLVGAGLGPGLVASPGWPAMFAVLVGTIGVSAGVGALAAAGPSGRPAAELVRYE